MTDGVVSQMLANHQADSWKDLSDGTDYEFDNERLSPRERLVEYVEYCFDTYSIVSGTLDRDKLCICTADWDRRRGQARRNKVYEPKVYGKRVPRTGEKRVVGHHSIFVAEALIGVPPEDDSGVGWKATTRHELGHVIDYAKRGRSGHDQKFKRIMSQFGEQNNDGASSHGYRPEVHR